MASADLPSNYNALFLNSFSEPLQVKQMQRPQAGPGNAVVKVLSTHVLSYARTLFNGTMQYPLKPPQTIGSGAIARIAALGPDAASLTVGQLVLIDSTVYARDDPSQRILFGTHAGTTPGAQRLMEGEWRHATYAEYAKVPLENCFPLNEEILTKKFGYTTEELVYMLRQLVPMGGLVDLDIKPGDRVVIAPASGSFGGAAIEVAVALGANVIAAARNVDKLRELTAKHERIELVKLTGDVDEDSQALQKFGEVDAYLDFSPPAASKSTHILACLSALKMNAKASLMGGIRDLVSIPYSLIMYKNLQLRGKFMYGRGEVFQLVKMVESGLLQLGSGAGLKVIGPYGLKDWDEAFTQAEKNSAWGMQVVIKPGME
jgi:threonine dehydrogenase-like Zn-dependent dehydrogenase